MFISHFAYTDIIYLLVQIIASFWVVMRFIDKKLKEP